MLLATLQAASRSRAALNGVQSIVTPRPNVVLETMILIDDWNCRMTNLHAPAFESNRCLALL